MAVRWLVDEAQVWDSLPLPTPAHPSLDRESMSVREGVLSWKLNAESIQLHHPPLHLTFQGTHTSSLRCQTFSTCYLLWVPYVNSSSVSGGWAPRSGSTKVDAKMGLRVRLGPVDCHPLLVLLAACSARDDAVSESEKGGCVKFTSVIHSKLSVGGNYFSGIRKTPDMKEI